MLDSQRRDLFAIYSQAIHAVHGRQAVCNHLRTRTPARPVYVAAIGKAAAAMAAGAFAAWGEAIQQALVITRYGYAPPAPQYEPRTCYLEAGHPQPDAASLAAGQALVEFLSAVPAAAQCLVLISGGASALVEVLPAGINLAAWQSVNTWLIASGLDIRSMNAVRCGLSCIKGGRLVRMLNAQATEVLLISDVPGDDPSVIGSGLLCPATNEIGRLDLPFWIEKLLHAGSPPLAREDPDFANIRTFIVANNAMARQAAVEAAHKLGYASHDHSEALVGNVTAAAQIITSRVLSGPPGVYLWGGEVTLKLPPHAGPGGRNQHLALECATYLHGRSDAIVLAGGTDGSDGSTSHAGALVDGGTLERGRSAGLDAQICLANADATRFLQASGDLFSTGPTGTNVMDLTIAMQLS